MVEGHLSIYLSLCMYAAPFPPYLHHVSPNAEQHPCDALQHFVPPPPPGLPPLAMRMPVPIVVAARPTRGAIVAAATAAAIVVLVLVLLFRHAPEPVRDDLLIVRDKQPHD